jgi:hypothetical protein
MQAGFRAHRSTTQKTTQLVDIITLAQQMHNPLHVCYIDLRKAYDSVSHEGLWTTLRAMQFDEHFITILQAMYADNVTRVITPHGLTDDIAVTRGLRQGCPLSPLLFVLLLEPLLQRIEADPECKGAVSAPFAQCSARAKTLAYADDIALVAHSRRSIQNALDHCGEFCAYHGMSIGVDSADTKIKLKTVYTCTEVTDKDDCGDDADDAKQTVHVTNADGTHTDIPRVRADEHYKYLGVWISLTLDWAKHIEYVDAKVTRYTGFLSNRCFTAAQCVLAANRILAPRAAYGFVVAHIPEKSTHP